MNPNDILEFLTGNSELANQLKMSGEWEVYPIAGYPSTGDATWRCTRK